MRMLARIAIPIATAAAIVASWQLSQPVAEPTPVVVRRVPDGPALPPLKPRLKLAFTFVDTHKPLRGDVAVFQLLIDGEPKYTSAARRIFGPLSAERWVVVVPRSEVFGHEISPRLRFESTNTTAGNADNLELVNGFEGTTEPEGVQ